MGFLARLFGMERREAGFVPDPYLAPFLPLLPPGSFNARAVTPEHAVSVLAVAARCTSLISEGLASLPCTIYRRLSDGGREAIETHPLHRLLNDAANDAMSAFELRELLLRDLTTFGNAYARIVHDGRGAVAELHYLVYGGVGVERLSTGRLRYRYSDPLTGRNSVFLPEEIVHLRCFSKDGLIGISPLMRSAGAVSLAMAQADLAETQANRGFVPDMSFETEGTWPVTEQGETAFRRLKEDLTARLRGMGRDGRPLLLEGGLKAKPLAAPGREQQFFEARVLSLEDVARIYGVPLSVVGLGKNASYGSLTEESRALRQNCFAPWSRRVEAQLQLALLSAEGRREYTIEHDLSGLERGDMLARLQAYEIGIRSEIWNPNEVRIWEGMGRREGGDTFRNPAVSHASPQDSALE
ncbi:HK97 family phage portal protein [Microvirga lupini]|uniref:HK97 family phage portal protein n=1 Tax=Microvirga lupini TaxID=420324 RepID=A0A7W4YVP3_9HYPH|nr:phage portal protein [Microvirga lupini]MBB3018605.1 HK97 family phage portal protein [Microvirga lupini]